MPLNPQFDHFFQVLPNPGLMLLPDAPKFTIVAVNKATLEATNSLEEDFIGKGIFEALPENPEDRVSKGVENLRNSLNLVIAKKDMDTIPFQKYDIPVRGTKKFKVKYANIQNIPIKDDHNNTTYIFHTIEDVTDKKNLEIAFETEKQRFNDLYLHGPFCMGILKGPNHVFELANLLYLQLIGKKDIIGKPFREVLPELEGHGVYEILDTVYKTGEIFSAKKRLIKFDKGGKGKPVEMYWDITNQSHKDTYGNTDGIFFFILDVTEKVQSRKKIEESEKRYRELIENLPVATYSCDAEGNILVYNKAAAELWGGEPEIGKGLRFGSSKIYNEDGDPVPFDKTPMAIALKDGRIITDQEIIIERPNGDKQNILTYPVPFLDSSGMVTGAVNVLIDITVRKKWELKLIQSEKSLKESQELGHLGNWEMNFATGIIIWSDELCMIYGLSPSENIQSFENWLSFVHPDDVDEVQMIMKESQKTFNDFFLNFRIVLKDGTVKHTSGKIKYSFNKTGELVGFYGVSQDLTEMTISNEKVLFQSKLLNIISQAAISTNTFGIINFWNTAATEIYGWTAEEALGKNVISLISTEQKEEDTKEIMKELSRGNSSKEFVVRHKGGHTFFVFSTISPIYDKQGKFEGSIEVSMDITARKKEEEKLGKLNKDLEFQNGEKENRAAELSLSNKELVKTNTELDRFVYSVSHDLRSPLTSILGLVSFIEEDSREPDTLEQVKMIRASINRLDGFIKNILSYSQNNRTSLERKKIPIKKTINEIVNLVRNTKDAKGISFQIDIDEQQPFYSDCQRFNTILENLISNAIKYHTEEVSGRYLKLTGTSNSEELKLSISDNGIGIDAVYHEKIFDMFYRMSGKKPGSGIGLYIVRETVEKMHGKIEVQSEKGVGTTFDISLKNLKNERRTIPQI